MDPLEELDTFDDVLKYHGHTQETFNDWCKGLRLHEIGMRKEELIVAAYNGRQLDDPLPDWTADLPKRYALFKMPSASGAEFSFSALGDIHRNSSVGYRQVFLGENSLEHLLDAVSKFLPEYKESRTL